MINTIYKTKDMGQANNQLRIVYRLAVIAAISMAVACSTSSKEKKGDVTDKKVELQKLKDEQTKLADQIKKLEEEIFKLDPNAISAKPKLVSVTTLTTQSFVHYIDLQGRVDAENIANVSPRGLGGQVKAIYVKEGDFVKKGQLLMKLDDAVSRQQIEQVKVQLDLAKSVYQRRKNLWDQQIGTEVELITAKNNVDNLEKQIDLLNEQLSMSNVYAEMSGVVDIVSIKVGEVFSPQSAAMSGIRIVNSANLKVVVDVPENYLGRVRRATPVLIDVPDMNKTFNSSISLISQQINNESRSFSAEAKLPSGSNLRPNQLATVRIQDYSASNAMVVPMNTVQTDQDGKYVYVMATENGKVVARKKPVIVGELNGDQIEIKQGLAAGDKLISEGFQSLYDGQLITTDGK
ncbi:MAG TPA: efflux RND transporter periplasmic adaptor subunit [Chitinophagaceae bacterium]|nr:efflux RND transporter periplasmic adaptor subunit [Chitinophagaceae bacterium]